LDKSCQALRKLDGTKNPEALSATGVSIKVFYEGEQKNPALNLVVVEKIRKKWLRSCIIR